MTVVTNERETSEATSLLRSQPSAHSTDLPTRRSYSGEALPLASSCEDLRQSVELQLKELNNASMSKVDAVVPSNKVLSSKHAILILIVGCALSVLLATVINLKPKESSNIPEPVKKGAMPFSLLDPVRDLHLASFVRPSDSSPPKHMFTEWSEKLSMAVHGPIPTNAWYQNLLMLRGEPSNVHQVYSTPYLVDVVGPIPGLRVDSNHILSSTSVLQLTFNEQFGLTIGAAPSLAHDSVAKKSLDYKYQAIETTQLGLTLKWVRPLDRVFKFTFFSQC